MKFEAVRAALPHWPRLLSRELAADYVGLGLTTIDNLPGFPAPKRVGRRALYDRKDLDRWADALDGQPLDPAQEESHKADVERDFLEGRAQRKAQP